MNRHVKRLDALEPAVMATMPLAPDVEAFLQRLATQHAIPVDELRQDAIRVALATRGMTEDERVAWAAATVGCTPDELRRDMEGLRPCRALGDV